MNLGKIVQFGLYDSKLYHTVVVSAKRKVAHFEIDFILESDEKATSFIDEQSYPLKPNLLILRKPNQVSFSRLHFKCYCLHLETEEGSELHLELLALPNYFPFISETTYRPLFEALFRHIVKFPDGQNDYFTAAKILELVYRLKQDATRNQTPVRGKESASVQKAVAYLKSHFDEPIDLKTLGALTGYTPNHFRLLFTEIMKISPQKYLEEIRLGNAKLLLAKNELSLSDITYACGFSSQSYFCKLFKKTTGCTPNEFRKQAYFDYEE